MSPPGDTRHEVLEPLPASYPVPAWLGRHPSAHWRRSTGESWTSSVSPEELARPPRLEWTEQQRRMVLEALSQDGADQLEAGEWLTISWPPEATLWAAGDAFQTEGKYCEEHDGNYVEDCEVCQSCERSVELTEPAVWDWEIVCTVWEQDELGNEHDISADRVMIMRTYVDPRDVDYAEGEWE